MAICRWIWLGILLVAPVWAGDTTAASDSGRKVYTVGVDARTGKLVRVPLTRYTRPVSSKAVAAKPVAPVNQPEREIKETVVAPHDPSSEPALNQPRPVYMASDLSFDQLVNQVALHYGIQPGFVHAVIKAESNYNPRAISPKGALGLMQLMPRTARRFGVEHVFNPAENLEGGVRYLRYLMDLYDRDPQKWVLSLAAYNAGEGAVDRFGGVPPYWETRRYVRRVSQLWDRYKTAFPLTPAPAPRKLDGPTIYQVTDASGATRYTTETQ